MSLLDPRVLECMVLRTEVLRRLAALPAPDTVPGTDELPGAGDLAADDPLDEAERCLSALLDQWPSGEQVPGEVYAARGGVLLDRARRAARGHEAGPRSAQALAVRAADDLDTATVLLRRRGSAADRLVCETLLDLAAARQLHDGAGLPSVLPLLERARETARALDDPALEAAALRRTAAVQRAVHTRTGDLTALDAALAALAAALRLATPDSPEHSALLAERGAALLLRARQEPAGPVGKRLANEAVHVLREALGRAGPQDPDLGHHRLLFGRALRLRYERQPSLADLHEADWILELAARGVDVPDAVAAEAWLEVGDIQLLLDRRFDSRERHDRAAACFRRAAAAARRAGSPCWPPVPTTAAARSWRSPPPPFGAARLPGELGTVAARRGGDRRRGPAHPRPDARPGIHRLSAPGARPAAWPSAPERVSVDGSPGTHPSSRPRGEQRGDYPPHRTGGGRAAGAVGRAAAGFRRG
ncbi:hypothetical protein O1L68_12990 [Streptomyces lydicus]|nr:hypothetical protein [Streptomyces lydicus]